MQIFFSILFPAISLGIAGCTIHFFYSFLEAPAKIEFFGHSNARPRHENWKVWTYLIAVFCGLYVCIYHGAMAALSWMPHSWVGIDEDGRAEWYGYTISYTFAFVASVGLLDGLLKANTHRLELELERDRLNQERWAATPSK